MSTRQTACSSKGSTPAAKSRRFSRWIRRCKVRIVGRPAGRALRRNQYRDRRLWDHSGNMMNVRRPGEPVCINACESLAVLHRSARCPHSWCYFPHDRMQAARRGFAPPTDQPRLNHAPGVPSAHRDRSSRPYRVLLCLSTVCFGLQKRVFSALAIVHKAVVSKG